MDIQDLIDSGTAWLLEGHVGRQCMRAIEEGRAMLPLTRQRDYWGGVIPSRFDVEPGTVGSAEFVAARQDEEGSTT